MTSEKAWYWVAAGVLALGLSNSLMSYEISGFRGLMNHFQAAETGFVAQASDHAVRLLDAAIRMSDPGALRSPRMQVALARVQSRVSCLQTEIAERQAEVVRREVEKARAEMIDSMPSEESCPRQKLRGTVTKVRQMPDDDTI